MAHEQPREVVGSRRCQGGVMAALGDGTVAGRVERHDLLDGGRATLLQLDGELVSHEPGLLDLPALGLGDLAALQQPGAGR